MNTTYFIRNFDRFFNDLMNIEEVFQEGWYNPSSFPPHNAYIDSESKDMIFELALAGYKKEDIKIDFEDDNMIVSVEKQNKERDEKVKQVHHGIKAGKANIKFYVPLSKYDVEKTKATFIDGILKLEVPAFEEIKKKVISIS
jgi:HSP20 family protein